MSRSDKFLLRSSEDKSEEEAEHKSTSYLRFASEPKTLKVSPSSKKISPIDECQHCQGKCEIKHPGLLLRRLFLDAFMVLWRRIPECQSQLWPVGNWFYFQEHHAESWRHLCLLPAAWHDFLGWNRSCCPGALTPTLWCWTCMGCSGVLGFWGVSGARGALRNPFCKPRRLLRSHPWLPRGCRHSISSHQVSPPAFRGFRWEKCKLNHHTQLPHSSWGFINFLN